MINPALIGTIAASSSQQLFPAPTSYWNLQTDGNDAVGGLNFTNNGVVFGSGHGAFNGSADLTQSNASALQLGSGDWTILTWVYLNALPNYVAVLAKGTGSNGEYEIFADPFDGGFYINVYRPGSGSDFVRFGGLAPATGVWHFLCGQYVASSGTLRLLANAATTFSSVIVGAPPRTTTEALTLGNRAGGSFRLNGRMRFTGLFKGTLLDADAIAYYYNSGNGRAYP